MGFAHKLDEALKRLSNLNLAVTGQPFDCILYRGECGANSNSRDPARGVFWTSDPDIAKQYATDPLAIRKKQTRAFVKHFTFTNPFVADSSHDVLAYMRKYGLIDERTYRAITQHGGALGVPFGERIVAAGMRRHGYDAIIYPPMAEVVVLS